MFKRIEDLTYEERPSTLELFRLEKRRLKENLSIHINTWKEGIRLNQAFLSVA